MQSLWKFIIQSYSKKLNFLNNELIHTVLYQYRQNETLQERSKGIADC